MNAAVLRAIRTVITPRPRVRPTVAVGAAARRFRGSGRQRWPEVLLVLAVIGLATVARRPWVLLARPLAVDEGWLAATVRTPLRMAAEVASSAPLGWTLLLRAVPVDGVPERLRLVPLVFAVAAVVPAYLLGRLALPGAPMLGGLVGGLAGGLAPSMLAQQQLRHDTAEGFAAVLLVLIAVWVERRFSTRRLAVLVAVAAGCALLAHTAVLVFGAAVGMLALVAVHESDWRRLRELLVAGAVAVVVAAALYVWTVAPSAAAALPRWEPAMVPVTDGPGYATWVVARRTMFELERAGFGPWPLALPAVGLGVVALWRGRLRAAAAAGPVLWLGFLAAGLAGRYPFLADLDGLRWSARTSVGLSVLLTVTAALGVTWAARWLWHERRPGSRRSGVPGAVTVSLCAVGVFATALGDVTAPRSPAQELRGQDVRAQVAFVRAERRPGDAVVVEPAAAYTFAAYWPDAPRTLPAPDAVVRYRLDYPELPGVFTNEWPPSFGLRRVWVVGTPGQTPELPPAWLRVRETRRPLPGSPLRLLLVGPRPQEETGVRVAARAPRQGVFGNP